MTENKTMIQFFEWYCPADGEHWKRFKERAAGLLALGISAAWLPPAYKGTRGDQSEGYDVYDIYDLGEFDQKGSVKTKYGSKQEYLDAIEFARSQGLRVYIDVVLNHMGGAEETEQMVVQEVDATDRRQFTGERKEIEAYTKFVFPGRKGKYSNFQWNRDCFTGIDHAVGSTENGIYKIINEHGEGWEPLTHDEKGNFDYLILNDIETRNPAVREELKKWIKWYYETVQFDGVRLDAVKHINPSFFIEWIDFVHRELDPNLFILGEFWLSDDLPVLQHYLDVVGDRMSLFDAPLHHNFSTASVEKSNYDLRNIFDQSLVSVKPAHAVTFADNHDTQPLQSLEEYTEHWFKPHAYALILLRQDGYPCVFYPDLYGTRYSGKNKNQEDVEVELLPVAELPALLDARKKNAYGQQKDYFDEADCIAFVRMGTDDLPGSGCVVLLSNAEIRKQKKLRLGSKFARKSFINLIGAAGEKLFLNDEGEAEFFVEPRSISVWAPAS